MKLKDLEIGTQLKIGMGAILTIVVLLGVLAWKQTDAISIQTKSLYDHPLTVRMAIGELYHNVLQMRIHMRGLPLAENEQNIQAIRQKVGILDLDVYRQVDILYDRYLGNRKDIDDVLHAVDYYKTIRNDTFLLLRAGKGAEVAERLETDGICGVQVAKVLDRIKVVDDFAKNKGDQLYRDAEEMNRSLTRQLGVIVVVILLLSFFISWLLLQNIRKPLTVLTRAMDRFSGGDMEARSHYSSANEFGILSARFNALAETVQSESRSRESVARIAQAMLHEEDLHAFCRELLKGLMAHTGSQIGAVYLRNDQKTAFDHFESIGLAPVGRASFSAVEPEGEFGAALASGQIQHIVDIPEDARFSFTTVAGEFQPREIITIPVPGDDGIVAVISLAGVRSYTVPAMRLVNDVWNLVTARLNGVVATGMIRDFAQHLEQQNEELQTQQVELESLSEELHKQTEELQEQNVELERQRLVVEEGSRLKSQFLSNMSHELRTPLNSVMALSRVLMMQAKEKLSEEEVSYLEIIERNGKNLLGLINDILDLAKIEAGRMDIHPKNFSLGMTLENIVESIRPLAGEKQLEIRQDIPEDLPLLESDEIRVSQILQNLLANAVKFTDAGSVSISVRSDQEKIFVQVIDTGIGIAQNELPYIFDEFRQADGTSARRHEGTGLGLAIARKAARILSGDIFVESAPGQGSTFTLVLPISWPGTVSVHDPIQMRPPSDVKKSRKTILVVDDEPEMASMISRYLIQEGYNTVIAASGTEALKLAARERPFAITLDVIMPDLDGWEVLQRLKNNPETMSIPVIVVSVSEDRATGFALGAIGYITKPVSATNLIAEIRRIGTPQACSILIVDDNDLDRQEIRRIVEEEGFNPIVAEGGAACMSLLTQQVPDVLVLDLMMPELDGFAVLERIRAIPETLDLPVIVVTAKDLTAEDRKKLSGNVSSVLGKSAITSGTLLAEIKRLLTDLESLSKSSGDREVQPPKQILLVEDNDAAIIQVRAVLESAGYRVSVARGGQEAIAYVAHTIPDGIILDLMMPEMDGFAVLEKIRGTQATTTIPVLILTAKDLTYDDLNRLSANNVQQLAQKGDVDRDNLLAKVRAMFGPVLDTEELHPEPDPPSPHPVPHYSHPIASKPDLATILIIEDNRDNMVTIKAVLRNRYHILEATDGEAGLQKAGEVLPDLILLDLTLPKMDGLSVVRHLKDNNALASIPVIAMTARVMKGDREEVLEAGCDDYISKPIDPEDCLKKIDGWLNK